VTVQTSLRRLRSLLVCLALASCAQPQQPDVSPVVESVTAPGYTGAESCRPCHPNEFSTWEASSHGQGMGPATEETIVGDFSGATVHRFRGFSARMMKAENEFYVILDEDHRAPDTLKVDLVIGTRQMQGYLTRMADGRYQELPVVVQRTSGNWVEASSGGTLPTDITFGPTDWYYWRNPGRAWNFKCYNCHASQIQKGYDLETNTYETTWVDLSINCETCHGPGADHVRLWNSRISGGVVDTSPDTTLINLSGLTPQQSVGVCIQCHALKTIADDDYLPGEDFNDHYDPILWDNEAVTWPDGLFRGDAYTYVGYLKNRCFVEGGMTCTHCHDSHGSPHPNDLTAPRDESDRFCASCHPDYASNPQSHTHHLRNGPGGRCIACHLPTYAPSTFLAEGMRLTDHRMVSPVPQATKAFGIPNACGQSGCHDDKTAAWADEWSRTWYGSYQDMPMQEITAVQNGMRGNPSAVEPLSRQLADSSAIPAARAVAASLLGAFPVAASWDGLTAALEDPSPLVRSRAALSLRRLRNPEVGLFLEEALADTNRFVRINAALALISLGSQPSDEEVGRALEAAWEEYGELLGGLWADDPQAHLVRGDLVLSQGDAQGAEEAYRQSLQIWRPNPEALVRLAELASKSGDAGQAQSLALEALQLHPGHPRAVAVLNNLLAPALQDLQGRAAAPNAGWQAHVDLGALLSQLGRYEESVRAYQNAIHSNPGSPDVYRELGLSLANASHYDRALTALQDYLKHAPDAPDADQVRVLIQNLKAER